MAIRFVTRKNDVDLSRLPEKVTPTASDRLLLEDTGRKRITFTNLVSAVVTSAVNAITPTGLMVPWLAQAAPSGWILASGRTIGSSASGATERANADTAALYSLLWQAFGNTQLHIQDSAGTPTTRGTSAADDFAANKRLPLPDLRDRVVVGLGDMGGVSADRIVSFDTTIHGQTGGTESVTLTEAELPPHTHDVDVPTETIEAGEAGTAVPVPSTTTDVTSSSTGDGEPFPIVQPSIALPFIIKL
jgi:microcystin-dependent protein